MDQPQWVTWLLINPGPVTLDLYGTQKKAKITTENNIRETQECWMCFQLSKDCEEGSWPSLGGTATGNASWSFIFLKEEAAEALFLGFLRRNTIALEFPWCDFQLWCHLTVRIIITKTTFCLFNARGMIILCITVHEVMPFWFQTDYVLKNMR